MKHLAHRLALTLAALALGCDKQPQTSETQAPVQQPLKQYYASNTLQIRYAPSYEPKVRHQERDTLVDNWIGEALRGTRLTVVETLGEWANVRLDDGAVGYVETANLVPADLTMVATVLQDTPSLVQPAKGAANDEMVKAGTLLLITETHDLYMQANIAPGRHVWIHESLVSTDSKEVAVSKLLVSARHMRNRGDTVEANSIFNKIRIKFPQTQLLDVAADEVSFLEVSETPWLETSSRAVPGPPAGHPEAVRNAQ